MNALNYNLVRIVFAFVLGLILVLFPDMATNYSVILVGGLFLVFGLFAFLSAVVTKKRKNKIDIKGILNGFFLTAVGVYIFINPAQSTVYFLYLISAVVGLLSLYQIVMLFKSKRFVAVPFYFFLLPLLSLAAAVYVLLNANIEMISTLFKVIGCVYIFESVVGFINWLLFIDKIEKEEKHEIKKEEKVEEIKEIENLEQ